MGRNTVPEVKPPTPFPGAGYVPEGNHSPLHRPPPLPQRFPFLAPPPLSALRVGGRNLHHADGRVPRPRWRLGGAKGAGLREGKEVLPEKEEEFEGGDEQVLRPAPVGRVRHDVTGETPYIQAPGGHLGLLRLGVGVW